MLKESLFFVVFFRGWDGFRFIFNRFFFFVFWKLCKVTVVDIFLIHLQAWTITMFCLGSLCLVLMLVNFGRRGFSFVYYILFCHLIKFLQPWKQWELKNIIWLTSQVHSTCKQCRLFSFRKNEVHQWYPVFFYSQHIMRRYV